MYIQTEQLTKNYTILLLFGLVIMVFFLLLIVVFAWLHQRKNAKEESKLMTKQSDYQRKLLEISIQREEQERLRIAQDLHDDVGAQLAATKFYLESISDDSISEEKQRSIEQVTKLISESIQRIRDISKQVTPPLINEYGLAKAIEHYVSMQRNFTNIHLTFKSVNYIKKENLTEIMFFRILQEIVTNSMKHGHPNRIDIRLEEDDAGISLLIEDNGKPFNIEEKINFGQSSSAGNGLKNIESRMLNCRSRLHYKHESGKNKILIYCNTPL